MAVFCTGAVVPPGIVTITVVASGVASNARAYMTINGVEYEYGGAISANDSLEVRAGTKIVLTAENNDMTSNGYISVDGTKVATAATNGATVIYEYTVVKDITVNLMISGTGVGYYYGLITVTTS